MRSIPILAIQEFDRSNNSDFYIRILSEHLTNNHHSIFKPHKHDFYLTVLFTAGNGTHEVDFELFRVQRGSLFFLNPGQTHDWKLSEDVEGFIFFHSESFYNLSFSQNSLFDYPFFYSTLNSPVLELDEDETQTMEQNMAKILEEYHSTWPWKIKKINNLVDGIYLDAARIYLKSVIETKQYLPKFSEKLKQLENLIDTHFKDQKSSSFYADKMNISAKHLNRIVQTSIGKTTTQLITDRTILEAKRLLSHAKMNLIEISESLGFADYPYFSRLFKKHTMLTPSEFKMQY